jgi:alkylated DNA repair dioxygenase AlkB
MPAAPNALPEKLTMPDAEVWFYPQVFTTPESERLLTELINTTAWRHDKIKLFGKEFWQPRLSAWYADAGKSYRYSNLSLEPLPWTPAILEIKARVEATVPHTFNSVLLNYYRHGQDSMGWHADNEPELGLNPVIASVSLGASRRFDLRHKHRKNVPKVSLDLTSGSILLMGGTTQHFWQHQLPKTARINEVRLNLTFRTIL